MRVPAGLESGEGSPPGLQKATFLLCLHMVEKKIWCLFLLIRALTPPRGPHSHELAESNYLPKIPSSNTIILGLRLQHMHLEGEENTT